MKFDLYTMKKGENNKVDLNFTVDFDSIDYYGDVFKILTPITVIGSIYNVGEQVFLTCNITTDLEARCGRCLKTFTYPMITKMNVELVDEGKVSEDDDTEDIIVYEDKIIDFDEIIKEEILANVPMKVLCDENCKGLCGVCGKDLNVESCQCNSSDDNIDPRLAELKKLL